MIVTTFIYEYVRAYVKQLGNKIARNVRIPNAVNEMSDDMNIKDRSDINYINRYLTKAIQILILNKYMGRQYVITEIENSKKKGLIHIEELLEKFDNKKKYSNFDMFYLNELITYFIDLDNSIKNQHNKRI